MAKESMSSCSGPKSQKSSLHQGPVDPTSQAENWDRTELLPVSLHSFKALRIGLPPFLAPKPFLGRAKTTRGADGMGSASSPGQEMQWRADPSVISQHQQCRNQPNMKKFCSSVVIASRSAHLVRWCFHISHHGSHGISKGPRKGSCFPSDLQVLHAQETSAPDLIFLPKQIHWLIKMIAVQSPRETDL